MQLERIIVAVFVLMSLFKNEYLAIAMGDLPPAECYQELWVLDAADFPQAQAVLESWRTATPLPAPDGVS